ncbi:hypothetical protein [Acidovorax sp. MR-S7]|uniref:hypothetical protein n=1 Tax=Acidovorax sp. MR-S7 TaxID=1268622 RepID=UPI0003600D12|nr:hypothetical protein [Acidovorax sp. MR-S7]GAD20936.1 hypothetical protein AVS7_00697 [Acidovorax sp. MR-S7]
MAEITPSFQGEIQLRRWSESSTQGVQVTLALADSDDLGKFRGLEGKRFMAVLVQIGDDEQPVPPEPAKPAPRERLGDLAWRAVQWCKEPEFIDFLSLQEPGIDSEHDAAAYIKRVCGVQSRKELDTSPAARTAFNQHIRGPYHKHLMARGLA